VNKKISLPRMTVVLLVVCLLVVGCANRTTATPDTVVATPEVTATPTAVPTAMITTITMVRADYGEGCFVTYPQIDDGDPVINDMIREDILTYYESLFFTDDQEAAERDVDFELEGEVKVLSDDWISIAYEGWFYRQGMAYPPSLFCSININLETRQKMCLSDYAMVDQSFVDSVLATVEQQHDPVFLQSITESLDASESVEGISPLEHFQQYDQEGSWLYSYRTADSIVLSLPVRHALGDYVLITLPN